MVLISLKLELLERRLISRLKGAHGHRSTELWGIEGESMDGRQLGQVGGTGPREGVEIGRAVGGRLEGMVLSKVGRYDPIGGFELLGVIPTAWSDVSTRETIMSTRSLPDFPPLLHNHESLGP